jgi:hypothetical protein
LWECKDGCSGPLCESEDHCEEQGKKQVVSRPAIHSSTSCDFAWAEIDTLCLNVRRASLMFCGGLALTALLMR